MAGQCVENLHVSGSNIQRIIFVQRVTTCAVCMHAYIHIYRFGLIIFRCVVCYDNCQVSSVFVCLRMHQHIVQMYNGIRACAFASLPAKFSFIRAVNSPVIHHKM